MHSPLVSGSAVVRRPCQTKQTWRQSLCRWRLCLNHGGGWRRPWQAAVVTAAAGSGADWKAFLDFPNARTTGLVLRPCCIERSHPHAGPQT